MNMREKKELRLRYPLDAEKALERACGHPNPYCGCDLGEEDYGDEKDLISDNSL